MGMLYLLWCMMLYLYSCWITCMLSLFFFSSWACCKVLVVCKCLLLIVFRLFSAPPPPISPFFACRSPVPLLPPPPVTPLFVCSDAAPSTEPAAHGWYLSLLLLLAQHAWHCMPADLRAPLSAPCLCRQLETSATLKWWKCHVVWLSTSSICLYPSAPSVCPACLVLVFISRVCFGLFALDLTHLQVWSSNQSTNQVFPS